MKYAIIYHSFHHGNTKKLINSIAKVKRVELISDKEAKYTNLDEYDVIGFASGIYFWGFHKDVIECAKEKLPKGKDTFLIYTCSIKLPFYVGAMKKIFRKKNCRCLGQFSCKGYNTYSVFKKIGGIAKNRPNQKDKDDAVAFFKKIEESL